MDLDIGYRFDSYNELKDYLNKFCEATNTKYWKRDARTIGASRSSGNLKEVNPDLVYYELKFTCIYGGIEFKSRAHHRRKSSPLKSNGCPSYLRFKVSEDGESLQLVAMNFKHNHELTVPEKRVLPIGGRKRVLLGNDFEIKSKRLQDLTALDNVELEQEGEDSSNDLLQMLQDPKCEGIFESKTEGLTAENYLFKGLVVPVLTPFHDDAKQSLNLDIIPTYANFLKDNGVDGVLVNGPIGEGMSMTVDERKLVTEAWVDAVAEIKQHIIVHVGGAPLPDVLELAKHSDNIGVNCIMCLPDLFFKPQSVEELITYIKLVSDAAPHTPLLYQHIPQKTNVNIHMGHFLQEVSDKVPMLAGIEFSSSALDEGYAALKADDGKFAVFLGVDKLMAGAFMLGFNSGIFSTLNMWPTFGQNICHLIEQKKAEEAIQVQDQLNTIVDSVSKFGNWISVLKILMKYSTPVNVGIPRKPLTPLTEDQEKELELELTKNNFC
ncbi:N-acetylneuraminate lyase isoform X2 [Agrilus planipennis]|uniref:N-acetylneuraminate lyase n=1 Tax=Agrilus planipennis TaxID=224129 RepID=A0A1W4X969_AGRPL|nr:N-acetylneuraminate lyase isoform X2 [Agrilus planipennis]